MEPGVGEYSLPNANLFEPQRLAENAAIWIAHLDEALGRTIPEDRLPEIMAHAREVAQSEPVIHVAPMTGLSTILENSAIMPNAEGADLGGTRSNTFDFDIELGLSEYVFGDINKFHWSLDRRAAFFIDPRFMETSEAVVTMEDFANLRLAGFPPDRQIQIYQQESFTGKDFYREIFPRMLALTFRQSPEKYHLEGAPFRKLVDSPFGQDNALYVLSPEVKLPAVPMDQIMGLYYSPGIGIGVSEQYRAKCQTMLDQIESTLAKRRGVEPDSLIFSYDHAECYAKTKEIITT